MQEKHLVTTLHRSGLSTMEKANALEQIADEDQYRSSEDESELSEEEEEGEEEDEETAAEETKTPTGKKKPPKSRTAMKKVPHDHDDKKPTRVVNEKEANFHATLLGDLSLRVSGARR